MGIDLGCGCSRGRVRYVYEQGMRMVEEGVVLVRRRRRFGRRFVRVWVEVLNARRQEIAVWEEKRVTIG